MELLANGIFGGFLRRLFKEPNVPLLGADVVLRIADKENKNNQHALFYLQIVL